MVVIELKMSVAHFSHHSCHLEKVLMHFCYAYDALHSNVDKINLN